MNTLQMMKAIEITKPGEPDVLRMTERPMPKPGTGQILMKISAAGVNRPDILQRRGAYPPPPGASDLPGLEASGTIVGSGDGVVGWSVGDPICALLPGGGYAEYAVVDARACLPIPEGLDMTEASTLPETMLTVWANLFVDAGLVTGERALVHGGTSGIGVTAIAMCRAIGAKIVVTCGAAQKCAAALDLGASAAFHYAEDDWVAGIKELGGVEVVLDMTGGDFLPKNLECLNDGGRHVSIAFLRGADTTINIFSLMRKRLRLSGSTLRSRSDDEKAALVNGLKGKFWPLLEAGNVKIPIFQAFALEDAAEAHRVMEAGDHVGKIVLTVP
ncbi:MAG: NAD(P)H-quinone oxidoreductase [Pseudomonadota bacterium]